MPLIKFMPHEELCPEGLSIEVETGTNVLELAHAHNIKIESACGGVKACTTCHVVVRQGFDSLEGADDGEEDMLNRSWGLEAQSRLGCQVAVGEKDLVIELPSTP